MKHSYPRYYYPTKGRTEQVMQRGEGGIDCPIPKSHVK